MRMIPVAVAILMAPVMALADDNWTGFNAGVQIGRLDASTRGYDTGNSSLGIHGGYLHDFDGYVFGGEVSYDVGAELNTVGDAETADILRVKIKGGHVFGKTHVYGTVGYVNMDGDSGSRDGITAGVGFAYRMSETTLLGLEYLQDDLSSGSEDTKADSLNVRWSYRF